ncbi:MAG: hypothetical protein E7590_05510 [Ruminococcaceae bacterium]|nr:hypothetical protein [Oscillospiraceae bacterium]
MKAFFGRYGYTALKLFLDQFAIALFGVGLSFACAGAGNNTLLIITSIGAVLFYLFLQYAVMWEIGAKDGISATAKGQSRGLWRGFVIGLIGNALNLLCALCILPGAFVENGFSKAFMFIGRMVQGMYMGLLAQPFMGLKLHDYAWVYFVIFLPSVLLCGVAYIIGSYNLHATNILIPKNKDVKNNGRPE